MCIHTFSRFEEPAPEIVVARCEQCYGEIYAEDECHDVESGLVHTHCLEEYAAQIWPRINAKERM